MAGLSMSCSFDRPAKLLILFNRLGVQARRLHLIASRHWTKNAAVTPHG